MTDVSERERPAPAGGERPPQAPGFPWPTLALLDLALLLIWQVRPEVPSEAPLGAPPPQISGVLSQVVPTGAAQAPVGCSR